MNLFSVLLLFRFALCYSWLSRTNSKIKQIHLTRKFYVGTHTIDPSKIIISLPPKNPEVTLAQTFTPIRLYQNIAKSGELKGKLSINDPFKSSLLGLMAGAYISLGKRKFLQYR